MFELMRFASHRLPIRMVNIRMIGSKLMMDGGSNIGHWCTWSVLTLPFSCFLIINR